jgi:hypothetical protein|tara:strand:- start:1364 stop:1720 length:357 start_codon:yes stop_codon:yes gene_type:complete
LQSNAHAQPPSFPYPFGDINNLNERDEVKDIDNDNDAPLRVPSKSLFGEGNANISSVPRTIGNVFSQEWRDLLKFIAVSKGSTSVPQGIKPLNYRPANLPVKSAEEQKRVNQLVEENR